MSTIVTNYSNGSAIFDFSQRYRYVLTRHWPARQHQQQVTFIMLNPSQANAEYDDPTIRACSQFAQNWGFSKLNVVNLFAYRTAQPSMLKQVSDPIGSENERYLLETTKAANKIILAWGNWGQLFDRSQHVLNLVSPGQTHKLYCLGYNKSGQPRHPLYIKRSVMPIPWQQD